MFDVIQFEGKLIGYIQRDGGLFKAYFTKDKPPGEIIGVFKDHGKATLALIKVHHERANTVH